MRPTPKTLTYQICVRGRIPAAWVDAFADLHRTDASDACGALTRLNGEFSDLAALQGVLNNLCMLGLVLISVVAQDECSHCSPEDLDHVDQ